MTQKDRFLEILQQYLNGTALPFDRRLLEEWYNKYGEQSTNQISSEELETIEAELAALLPLATDTRQRRLWPRIAAAAAVLIVLATGAYLLLERSPREQQLVQVARGDISPGHNQATLTLMSGKKIILVQGMKGQLAMQGGTRIHAADSSISYLGSSAASEVGYNTLSTSTGERSPYPLVLADGTRVWLNAASSITFPTAFNGRERVVRMTGEAYFEVAHNPSQPFRVESPGQITEDLGTHFNVMSYAGEPASRVTLAEGSVRVNGHLLKPGEQSINREGEISVAQADVANALAWKDGYFRFTDAPLTQVMRELARWYNIEVVYQGPITQEKFNARISRYKNISSVLRILERTKVVEFKIEGRRVTVKNKS